MTRTIKNILFATDFSDSSQQAADYAVTLAHLTDAQLHVLHVINELDEHQRVMIPREAFLVLEKEVEVQAVKELEKFCREQTEGLSTATHAVVGAPFKVILEMGGKVNADLIVMGTHGKGLVSQAFFGSVAKRVLRRVRKPVFIIPLPEK